MGLMNIVSAWRAERLLSQTLDEFVQMVEDCHWMYQQAVRGVWEDDDTEGIKKAIRARDIQVNKAERSIRKKIVEHLAMHPGVATNYCLVLMSVVKDAERLGDYAKNMIEVAEYHPTYQDQNPMVDALKGTQATIAGMFVDIGRSFRDSDAEMGAEIVKTMTAITEECDELLWRILETGGLCCAQAMCYGLLARHYKRFAAHLGNIATSLVMPIHKLDYYDEDAADRV